MRTFEGCPLKSFRWKHLEYQTIESLNRYKDERHKELIPEVNQAIEAKLADEPKSMLVT